MGQSQTTEKRNYKEILEEFHQGPYWRKFQQVQEKGSKLQIISKKESADNSVVYLSHDDMDKFNLFRGDTITIFTKSKMIIFVVLEDSSVKSGSISFSKSVARNCLMNEGDFVYLENSYSSNQISYGKKITISPLNPTVMNEDFLKILLPYFCEAYRPKTIGETFEWLNNDYLVSSVESIDSISCIVAPETKIEVGEIIWGNIHEVGFTFIEDLFTSKLFTKDGGFDVKFSFY
jgi:formylmethanofuran dehydrogenase subunit D